MNTDATNQREGPETRKAAMPPERVRCLCGKWWAIREGEALVLKCKLCKREIVISGDDLRIEYR